MTRIHRGASVDLQWINVSVARRCPICDGSAGCKINAQGHFAACGTQPSDWPMTSGAWLHRLGQPVTRIAPAANDTLGAVTPPPSTVDAAS